MTRMITRLARVKHMRQRVENSIQPDIRISCVIPTRNEADAIARCLEQFVQLSGRWELIVTDSGSTDGTQAIVASYPGVRLVDAPAGRGAGMNAGAALATGDLLLFLHADTALPQNAWRLITSALANRRTSATAFQLQLDRLEPKYRLVALASRIRVRLQRTFFGDQAIAVRRNDFLALGGFQETTLMEDVDLSRRLRALGRLTTLPAHVTTSARRFERYGVVRTLVFMTGLQLAYSVGIPAERLARRYAAVR